MNNQITTETSVHLVSRRDKQGELASDLTPAFIHFGTLSVCPIKLCALTSDLAESPEDFAAADRIFDYVRARLIHFSNEIESELGPGWKVMIGDADSD